jgi:hypothetical protein
MEFLGKRINRGDELTLERGKSRVTVDFYEAFARNNGFEDSFGTPWGFEGTSGWTVVGHTEVTPSLIPTTPGVYRAESPDGVDTLVLEAGTWKYGGYTLGKVTLDLYTSFTPLYASGEHFTVLSSDTTEFYDLVRYWDADESGNWHVTCTCKGFHFRKTCKHATDTAFYLNQHERRENV